MKVSLFLAKTSGLHFVCAYLGAPRSHRLWVSARNLLCSAVESFQPDIIHFANAGMAVYADLFAVNIPLVTTIHGNDLSSPWQLAPTGDVSELITQGLRRCARLIAVSYYTASLIKHSRIGSPIDVIHNACDFNSFQNIRDDPTGLLARLGVSLTTPILLTVGRLVARKGHRLVASALAEIDTPFQWIVVGDGPLKADLQAYFSQLGIAPFVTLTGWVTQQELILLYRVCTIFVLTPESLTNGMRLDSEGFGLVFHEASACGKPIVATDTGGCPEAVIDGVTGVLVSPHDPGKLRDTLQDLLHNPHKACSLGQAGRAHVVKNGGWTRVAEQVRATYTKLV